MIRCGWCGQFVPPGTQPLTGLNYYGVPVTQVLCPPHATDWRHLAALNVVKYHGMRR